MHFLGGLVSGWATRRPTVDIFETYGHCVLQYSMFLQKYWGAWGTACGQNAKDTPPSFAWRPEAYKKTASDDLLYKDETGSLSMKQTLEPFQGNIGITS